LYLSISSAVCWLVCFSQQSKKQNVAFQEKNDEATTEKQQESVLSSVTSLTLSDDKCRLRFFSLNKGLKKLLKHAVVRSCSFKIVFQCYFSTKGLPFKENEGNH
jgi:hypothetical protein